MTHKALMAHLPLFSPTSCSTHVFSDPTHTGSPLFLEHEHTCSCLRLFSLPVVFQFLSVFCLQVPTCLSSLSSSYIWLNVTFLVRVAVWIVTPYSIQLLFLLPCFEFLCLTSSDFIPLPPQVRMSVSGQQRFFYFGSCIGKYVVTMCVVYIRFNKYLLDM